MSENFVKNLQRKNFMVVFEFKNLRENHRKTLSSEANGWYFISVVGSLDNYYIRQIIQKYPNIFAQKNKFTQESYHYYLEDQSYYDIAESQYFVVSRDNTKKDSKLSFSPLNEYQIYAADTWKPFSSCNFDGKYYNCKNISDAKIKTAYEDPKVHSVIAIGNFQLHCRYTAGYLQSNANYLEYESDFRLRAPRACEKAGLDGEGQVVALFDTSLDMNHVFFYDQTYNVNGSVPNSTYNPDHRKIVKYDYLNGKLSSPYNHGTFIAGMVVGDSGNNSDSVNQYSGWLPKGKMHGFSINQIPNPSDLKSSFQETDSHIIYMPYGVNNNEFSYFSDQFDRFLYENPDKLIISSVGNAYPGQSLTISHPAAGENVLSVTSTTYPETTIEKSGLFGLQNGETKINSLRIGNSYPFNNDYTPIKNYQNLRISENDEEGCIYIQKDCSNPLPSKASIYIVFNESCNQSDLMPTAIFNLSDYDALLAMGTASVNWTGQPHPLNSYRPISGPLINRMRKPDLAANGEYERSARSNDAGNYTGDTNYSATNWMEGSSVSGAHITGMAVQVRQYFIDGYYPNGTKHSSEQISPSGNLIKSVLINSAKSPFSPIEDYVMGFGVPYEAKALGFDKYGVRFIDNIVMTPGGHVTFDLTTTREEELSITMSYLDYPISQFLAPRTIATNVDLVVDDGEKTYFGNMLERDAPEEYSTIEKIVIDKAKPGKYTIHLFASQFFVPIFRPPIVSIAISGGFDTNDITTNPLNLSLKDNSDVCPICAFGQTCANGKCVCDEGHYGPTCAANYTTMTQLANETEFNVSRVPTFFKINLIPSKQRNFNFVYTGETIPSDGFMRILIYTGPSVFSRFVGYADVQVKFENGYGVSIVDSVLQQFTEYYLCVVGDVIPLAFQYEIIPHQSPAPSPDPTPPPTVTATPKQSPTETIPPPTDPGTSQNDGKATKVAGIAAGVIIGILALIALILAAVFYMRRHRIEKSDDSDIVNVNKESGVLGNEFSAVTSMLWTQDASAGDVISDSDDDGNDSQKINYFMGENEW